jgi:uncharacterized protein YjbI with pentapeptide repeats
LSVCFFGFFTTKGIETLHPDLKFLDNQLEWPVEANLRNVNFSQVPSNWEDFETARNSYRRIWCEQNGIDALACGKVSFDGTVETDDLNYIRREWCAENLESNRDCLDYFDGKDEEFNNDWSTFRISRASNLSPIDLSNADLRRADLSGARLEGANLSNARLDDALLYQTRLEGANLYRARLQGASLRLARLEGANLMQASLMGSDLVGAQLEGANLRRAQLEGALLTRSVLQGANLNLARLERTDLVGANLQGASLNLAMLNGANLSLTRLERSRFTRVFLDEETTLTNANFEGAVVLGTDFTASVLEQTQLDQMFGDESVILPSGVQRPNDWPGRNLDWAEISVEWEKWLADPTNYDQ